MKFLEENLKISLYDLELGLKWYQNTTKEKLDRLNFIEIKYFCAANDTIKKLKRQCIEWEKTFATYISDTRAKIQII